jgi:hypothetical protein
MKYNLEIGNIRKTLLIVLLMIAWVPLSVLIINYLDGLFLRKDALIAMSIMFIPPVTFLILWLFFQKNKDVFTLTENGIESENHGIIKWSDIKICSWESVSGNLGIYLILKNKQRLMIGTSSNWKDYSKRLKILMDFFEEIKKYRLKLNNQESFVICKGRITKAINIFLVIVLISVPIMILIHCCPEKIF